MLPHSSSLQLTWHVQNGLKWLYLNGIQCAAECQTQWQLYLSPCMGGAGLCTL
jgi:hypothetical protein